MAALGLDSCNKNNHHLSFQNINHSQFGVFLASGRSMDQYELLNVINRGSYGIVYRARDKKTGEIVAMKMELYGFCRPTLTEIAILQSLPRHPSIVEFKEVVEDDNGGRVFVVMEYLETDLKRFMDAKRKPLTVSEVKGLMKQILEGVNFLHENGVMHRDLKPSNILMNDKAQLKICDFGLSCHLGNMSGSYTSRFGTLWYKAPELLLGSRTYSSAIDMWSVGCIMAELVLNEVLFRGTWEVDQLRCIYQYLGTPCNVLRLKLATAASFSGAPSLTDCGFDLLERLLACDPNERITAKDALDHNWFNEYYGLSA